LGTALLFVLAHRLRRSRGAPRRGTRRASRPRDQPRDAGGVAGSL